MGLFASRPFSSGNAAIFFLSAALYGAVFFMAQFLQTVQHHGPLDAGIRLLPWTATLFIVAPITGARIARVGERPFAVAGLLLQAAGMGWIALIAGPDVAYWRLVAPLAIAGCGVSMAMPAIQSAVVSSVAPASIGKASGTFNMMRQFGGVFGIATLVAVFTGAGSYGSPHLFSDGFTRRSPSRRGCRSRGHRQCRPAGAGSGGDGLGAERLGDRHVDRIVDRGVEGAAGRRGRPPSAAGLGLHRERGRPGMSPV